MDTSIGGFSRFPNTTWDSDPTRASDGADAVSGTIWEGGVGVSVLGPAGRHVTCTISLTSASGKELLSDEIGRFELPVTPAEWTKRFSQFAKDEGRVWTYLEAASGRFLIKGDELGEFALRLERDVKPVRWISRSINRVPTVRLTGDTGRDEAAVCRFFSLRRPAAPIALDTETVLAGFPVSLPGGLFEACHGDFQDTIIVSVPEIKVGFQGLVVEPDMHDLDGDSVQVTFILDLLQQGLALGIRHELGLDVTVALAFSLVDSQGTSEDVFDTQTEFEKQLDWSPPSLYLLKIGDHQHFSGTVRVDPLPKALFSELPKDTKSFLLRWLAEDGSQRRSVIVQA